MKKVLTCLVLLAVFVTKAFPQQNITGSIVDKESKEGIFQATIHLLKPDSTFVTGILSDDEGNFLLPVDTTGNFIFKVTSVGYTTVTKNVKLEEGKNLELGTLPMSGDAILLKGVVATGQAAKVVVKEDTFIYNSSAYRVPEGAVVEELVKRLPGAEVSDDGKITINGSR